jgi:methylase of polypeptide subunit release factors
LSVDARNKDLMSHASAQRVLKIFGINLLVEENVFSPDLGFTSGMLASFLMDVKVGSALDMGTGSLFLALVMRMAGVENVWAADNHTPAISCARKNLELNPKLKPITLIHSDLFEKIPENEKFQLIVFNQPYYPIEGESIAGLGIDGGEKLVERFLSTAKNYLLPGSQIIMPFSTITDDFHNPSVVADKLGWKVRILDQAQKSGLTHFIYSITR